MQCICNRYHSNYNEVSICSRVSRQDCGSASVQFGDLRRPKLHPYRSAIHRRSAPKLVCHIFVTLSHVISFRLDYHITMPATTAETLSLVNKQVSIAPLVLLSANDHFSRSAKGTKKRVLGVLLGQNDGKGVRVSNSFAG